MEPGNALRWRRSAPDTYTRIALEPTKTQRRRHLRKYAEGELPEDRSFYFQGPEGKLKLRAQNLITFMDLADGVDDDTWEFHLHRGDVSRWVREGIKDDELANRIAQIEREGGDALASRRAIRKFIEATYTLPAQAAGAPSH